MSSDDLLIVVICFLVGAIAGLLLIIVFVKDDQIECYKDYMEKNIIATRCEKYFKDLELGSDKDED